MNETHNPFELHPLPATGHLPGREALLETVKRSMDEGVHCLLFAPRGMGKSSILAHALGQAEARGSIVCRVDFANESSLGSCVATLRASLNSSLQNHGLPGTNPTMEPFPSGEALLRLLREIDRLALSTGRRACIGLDGVEATARFGGTVLLQNFGQAVEAARAVTYFVAGQPGPEAQQIAGWERDFGLRVQKHFADPIPPRVFAEWIEAEFARVGIVAHGVGQSCVEHAGPRTSDILYLAQRTCWQTQRAGYASSVDVDSALRGWMKEERPSFLRRWQALSDQERGFLQGAVSNPALLSAPSPNLPRLLQSGWIEDFGSSGLRIANPTDRGWALESRIDLSFRHRIHASPEETQFKFGVELTHRQMAARGQTV